MTRWRAATLIGVHVLVALHFLHWKVSGRTLAPVEPSEMFDTLHLGIVTVGALFMLGVVIATCIAGRFFCAWGCHILALQDLSAGILKKLKVPTKPIRSRTLLWVPLLAVFYLLVWPQIQRWLLGEQQPGLHVVTDPNGWSSFTTTDLLRSFPGLGMTLLTFVVVGFAIVYFLGSRSFCSYACPYGALFAGAERLAPLRILPGKGECSHCGLCVSSCKSNIRVIHEVEQFGTVMSSNCMRDLDCVSVCPTDALRLGVTKPPLLRSWRRPRQLRKQYDFSWGEDLLLAGVFLGLFPIVRGLYDAVSFLLALAVCAILAYIAVVAKRMVFSQRVVISNIELKQAGSNTAAGRKFWAIAAAIGVFVVHSGAIRYHAFAGERALSVATAGHGDDRVLPADLTDAEPLPAEAAPYGASDQVTVRSAALHHLQWAHRWGLVQPASLTRRLATAYQLNGADGEARNRLQLQLAEDPDDLESRLMLGHSWQLAGRLDLAAKHLQAVVEATEQQERPSRSLYQQQLLATAQRLLGDLEAARGRRVEAIAHFRAAVEADPSAAAAYAGLGAMLAAEGEFVEAATCFEEVLRLRPNSAAAQNNLNAVRQQLDRQEEGSAH